MDILNNTTYDTLRVRLEDDICFIQIYRPDNNNTINDRLIEEFTEVLDVCEEAAKIIVLEGLPEVFCFGADFKAIQEDTGGDISQQERNPDALYDLWLRLSSGPYVTIAHVRGKVNAGGVGFVAACDLVLCEEKTIFSLSELLFGLMPACVLPFLIRRMGYAKANYLTLMTQPVSAQQAIEWGLADACEENSKNLLRKHLLRLRRLNKTGIKRYKKYMNTLDDFPKVSKPDAVAANIEVFSDEENTEKIKRFVNTGKFPWES